MDTPKIFIGFDQVEAVAHAVLEYSLQQRAKAKIETHVIRLDQQPLMVREKHKLQTNEFSFSRWLTPYLCGFEGWAIFMDCDMLCLDDIHKLWSLRDHRYAVMVVQHDHKPVETVKYLGQPQTKYEKKNWSSMMLFNCAKCKALTPEYVNTATGLELHQFKWLRSDSLIGEVPQEWNHLVGYDAPNPEAKLVHFTSGGPYFKSTADCEFSEEWLSELVEMLHCGDQIDILKLR